eukprot:COSAG01_NODE_7868_length_3016_cov_4.815221_1_plen_705_part_00
MRYCDLIEGGNQPLSNQQRMLRVFKSAKEYQKKEKLEGRLKEFESIFPERLRPVLYAWALQKDPRSRAHLMELKWFIDQLAEMEAEQHSVLKSVPIIGTFLATLCCSKQEDGEPEFLEQMDPETKDELLQQLDLEEMTKQQKRAIQKKFQLSTKQLRRALEFAQTREEELHTERAPNRGLPRNSVAILDPDAWRVDGDLQDPHALGQQSSVEAFDVDGTSNSFRTTVPDWQQIDADNTTINSKVQKQRCVNCGDGGRACALRLKQTGRVVWTAMKLFFIGNVIRTAVSLIFVLTSWWLTSICAIQYWIDTDRTLVTVGSLQHGCDESRYVHANWWIVYIGVYYVYVLVLGPLIAAYYNSNNRPLFLPGGPRTKSHRPLFLATRELGRPKRDAATGLVRPECEGGAYQAVKVALEHLRHYKAARNYTAGTVVHVERESGGPVVRATLKSSSDRDVCIEFPDRVQQQRPKEDLKMPTLELPSESKFYDDSLKPEKSIGRKDLKLTRAEANRLVEFVSLRRRKRDGSQLFATVKEHPATSRLIEMPVLCDSEDLDLPDLIDLLTGLSSILAYEWLLFLSWLLTLMAIVLDSPTFQSVSSSEDEALDSNSMPESWLKQLVHEHKWIFRLLIYYFSVLCVYPLLKVLQDRGYLTCLEPCASKIRSMKRRLRWGAAQRQPRSIDPDVELESLNNSTIDPFQPEPEWGGSE